VQTIETVLEFGYDEPSRLSFEQVRGSLKAITGAWQLDALDGDRTQVTYELEVEAGGVGEQQPDDAAGLDLQLAGDLRARRAARRR